MFGQKSAFGGKRTPEQEAEDRKVEMIKSSIAAAVEAMKAHAYAPRPDLCEAAAKRVTELLRNPKAPRDFIQQMRARSDDLLKSCFMKAASAASAQALAAAHHGDKDLRSKKIGEARKHLSRAIQLKAPPEFKLACDRAIEAASLTGFVTHHGPTQAKPADFAPKALNRAKGDVPMKFEADPKTHPHGAGASTAPALAHWPARGEFVHRH